MRLVRVVLPRATYGLLIDERGVVRDAAPIARWMIGKDPRVVREWLDRKGATIEVLVDPEPDP